MSINWNALRTWDGQRSAYEELCCQLAAYESVPSESKFTRKGTPDGGVECFWTLPDGNEWGWQAKFFPNVPNDNQWGQIDDSIKTALEKHPNLTKYYVCLPLDRPDPRGSRQDMSKKWDKHVEKWLGWAQDKGVSIEFSYWGNHEFTERLAREEHRGRRYFWFHEETLSREWFRSKLEDAIETVGPRYTPELNIELPIASLFDGIGRTKRFNDRLKKQYGELKRQNEAAKRSLSKKFSEEWNELENEISDSLTKLEEIVSNEVEILDWQGYIRKSQQADSKIYNLEKSIDAARKADEPSQSNYSGSRPYETEIYNLRELGQMLHTVRNYATTWEAQLANTGVLLLTGEAGTGKTHLLCDIAKSRLLDELPSVVLLGEWFDNQNPLKQIPNLLDLDCTLNEFLGALSAAGEARGQKSLLMIDALNEGEAKMLWSSHLPRLLTEIKRYPWLSLTISVRTTYEDSVLPEQLRDKPDYMTKVQHYGFSDKVYEATKRFFNHFGILQPSVPLLAPEFVNPLFLMLFCKGLKNQGHTHIPPGITGITSVFDFFLNSVNEKLSRKLDFDPHDNLVGNAVQVTVDRLLERDSNTLVRGDAKDLINKLLTRERYEDSLFRHLISEGVISETQAYAGDGKWQDSIRFTYERFADHLLAARLLEYHVDETNPSKAFEIGQPLRKLFADEGLCHINKGLLEAFSIQLPEKFNAEFGELLPNLADTTPVREAFVSSITLREPKSISDKTLEHAREHALRYQSTFDSFTDALITVASNPQHPFNADFLHKNLCKHELAERDAWWSIYLHSQYGAEGAVDRLVDWAWHPDDKSHIEDEAVRLSATALAWFLTSSHRFLRDRATKALINLLDKRTHILIQVLDAFAKVNDPYVAERLYCVAYGCAMRTSDEEALKLLALTVYKQVFESDSPPVDILLRDYANGVIEAARVRGIELNIDLGRVRPPYGTAWLNNIPTEEEIKVYTNIDNDNYEKHRGQNAIIMSVGTEMGDFAKYVIHFDGWTNRRLNQSMVLTEEEKFNAFLSSLTERQRKAWEQYRTVGQNLDFWWRASEDERKESFPGLELTKESEKEITNHCESKLIEKLGKRKTKIFLQDAKAYAISSPPSDYETLRFDETLARRWIIKRVFDLGWTEEKFGAFDASVNRDYRYGRDGEKPERIGKKYQWIAYHEFLARVADNFEYKDRWIDSKGQYQGAWQISARDIDPSWLLTKTPRERYEHSHSWWFQAEYDNWQPSQPYKDWIAQSDDLPCPKKLIEVEDSSKEKWLILEGEYDFSQSLSPEFDKYSTSQRRIWYQVKSYIVHQKDLAAVCEWAKRQDFMGRWMPESNDTLHMFIGEYPWAEVVKEDAISEWTDLHRHSTRESFPAEVMVTSQGYLWERASFDCSLEDSVSCKLPNQWLMNALKLTWNGAEGKYFDDQGKPIAFDPSVEEAGPSALLVDKQALTTYLQQNGYAIFWTLLGEKLVTGEMSELRTEGRAEISGAYTLEGERIVGELTSKLNR